MCDQAYTGFMSHMIEGRLLWETCLHHAQQSQALPPFHLLSSRRPFWGFDPCCANGQGMLVQPGWDAVVPSKFTVKQIHCALDTGSLDQPVDLPGLGQGAQTSLQDLTAIPLDQQGSLLANIGQRVVNARCFIKEWGDGPHQAMLRFAGKACSVSTCRTNTKLLHSEIL